MCIARIMLALLLHNHDVVLAFQMRLTRQVRTLSLQTTNLYISTRVFHLANQANNFTITNTALYSFQLRVLGLAHIPDFACPKLIRAQESP